MNLDLKYYFAILLRRSPYLIAVTAVFTAIGATFAVILPAEYRATARLLVESEQIPERLAASTVQTRAQEQLQIIQQQLLTRTNLIEIANALGVYDRDEASGRSMTVGEIVDDMRSRTSFRTRSTGGSRQEPAGTVIMTVSFTAGDPRTAAQVTNEFVTRILQQNVELRTEQAGATLEFFQQEVERLGTELDNRSAQLLKFENEAGLAVPSNLTFLRERYQSLESRIRNSGNEITALEVQKQQLTDLFKEARARRAAENVSPVERQLAAAEQQLLNAQLVYSETNPKLSVLRVRVEQLRAEAEAEATASDETDDAGDVAAVTREELLFRQQIEDIDRKIDRLEETISVSEAQLQGVEADIEAAASNGATLSKLRRDFENVQTQYNQAVARLSTAETGERIELLAKGQRISIIEQATPPQTPTKPNRVMIAASGVAAGLAGGAGLVLLMELLNRSVRRPVELTNRLGITPIAVMPYIRTRQEMVMKRVVFGAAVAFLIIGVPLLALGVHQFVTPLDVLAEPYFNRLGFSIAG